MFLNSINNQLSFGIKVILHGTSPKALTKFIDTCALCGEKLEWKEERTFDHFLPTTKRGKTEFKNGLVLCEDCNSIVKTGIHPSKLFDEHPEMEANLATNYLENPKVKDIVIQRKVNKKESQKPYVDEFRAHAEQVLGRPLRG